MMNDERQTGARFMFFRSSFIIQNSSFLDMTPHHGHPWRWNLQMHAAIQQRCLPGNGFHHMRLIPGICSLQVAAAHDIDADHSVDGRIR